EEVVGGCGVESELMSMADRYSLVTVPAKSISEEPESLNSTALAFPFPLFCQRFLSTTRFLETRLLRRGVLRLSGLFGLLLLCFIFGVLPLAFYSGDFVGRGVLWKSSTRTAFILVMDLVTNIIEDQTSGFGGRKDIACKGIPVIWNASEQYHASKRNRNIDLVDRKPLEYF